MRLKADRLGLSERVFTINSFIEKCTNENPDLLDYKVLAVKKELFGNIDVADPFFATFREAYTGFEDLLDKLIEDKLVLWQLQRSSFQPDQTRYLYHRLSF